MGQKGTSKQKPSQNKNKGHNEPAGAASNVLRKAKNQPALIRKADTDTKNNSSDSKKGSKK